MPFLHYLTTQHLLTLLCTCVDILKARLRQASYMSLLYCDWEKTYPLRMTMTSASAGVGGSGGFLPLYTHTQMWPGNSPGHISYLQALGGVKIIQRPFWLGVCGSMTSWGPNPPLALIYFRAYGGSYLLLPPLLIVHLGHKLDGALSYFFHIASPVDFLQLLYLHQYIITSKKNFFWLLLTCPSSR
jgi:hypothetical protein